MVSAIQKNTPRSTARGVIVLRGATSGRAATGVHSKGLPKAATEVTLAGPTLDELMTRTTAVKSVLDGVGRAVRQAEDTQRPVKLTIMVQPDRSAPTVDVETMAAASDDLDLALAEARTRGAARASEILSSPDMLSADGFAQLIGVTREAVRQKAARHEALGLQGAKRGVRYPTWQVTQNGSLLPDLPQLFAVLGGNPWAVYRFLTQPHATFKGKPPLEALRNGAVKPVLEAANGVTQGDFG
ncbi:antitoxin Xre/MbcA/ParS toxin-binding domain-containing protein [Acidocella facilis]|uniref:antitoxin Xre/MbcA/ParS toxin-binding domain-containing protein n=1 Tax=Acidocella facilis TaxID=525 RepID=UPI001F1733C6|nr:antitoxin Xre/MbcA/ParS toxin-binding domain-containing protein [Acidocella facilis]